MSGPGGVGKGTVITRLVEADAHLRLSRSWTTRPRRPREAEDAYTFVDEEAFLRRVDEGGFLEWAKVLDAYYGTPVPEGVDDRDLVLEIDIQGARQVKGRCRDVVCVLLVAPSVQEQAARLRSRGDDEEHVRRRIELGAHEVADAEGFVDAIVVNDDIERATGQLAAIVEQSRMRFSS